MVRLLILVAVVVGVVLWLLKGRRPGATRAGRPDAGRQGGQAGSGPATMVACAHCGVHLPRPDASLDAEGRTYCGEPHRVAGPR